MNIDIDIASILSRLKEVGLTQSQIAADIGCSQPTISDMAAGKVGATRPSFKIVSGLIRICERHGIPTGVNTDQQSSQTSMRRKDDPEPSPKPLADDSPNEQHPSRRNLLECRVELPKLHDVKRS